MCSVYVYADVRPFQHSPDLTTCLSIMYSTVLYLIPTEAIPRLVQMHGVQGSKG